MPICRNVEGLARALLIGNAIDLADSRRVEVVGKRQLAHQKTSIAVGACEANSNNIAGRCRPPFDF